MVLLNSAFNFVIVDLTFLIVFLKPSVGEFFFRKGLAMVGLPLTVTRLNLFPDLAADNFLIAWNIWFYFL